MTVALIPVKSLDTVKNRLTPLLTPAQRRALVGAMLADLLEACAGTAAVTRTVVITSDPDVQAFAAEHEADAWTEPAEAGLNGAVNWASERAVADGADATLVITGDCPQATVSDLSRVLVALPDRGVVYVPSMDGTGTNAVFRRPGDLLPIAFGPGSLARHRALAAEAGIVPVVLSCPSLALDIDTPEDLVMLARSESPGRGAVQARAWLPTHA